MIDAYPLSWPAGWRRTPASERMRARFSRSERVYSQSNPASSWNQKRELTIADSVRRLRLELERMGVLEHTVIISTNVEVKLDGTPYSNRRAPLDPGIAVYWADPDTDAQQCMAIDLYDSVAGNLAAVAATIDAMRAIERHGGAQILKRAFQGFKALPSSTAPALNVETAADVLHVRSAVPRHEILSARECAKVAYRSAAAAVHPDRGGSTSDFQLVQEAKRVLETHFGGAL